MSTETEAKFYSVKALAEAVDVTPGRIRQLIGAGEIETEVLGRDHLIPAGVFDRFVSEFQKSNRGRPRAKPAKRRRR